jgi:hypothetical protein
LFIGDALEHHRNIVALDDDLCLRDVPENSAKGFISSGRERMGGRRRRTRKTRMVMLRFAQPFRSGAALALAFSRAILTGCSK